MRTPLGIGGTACLALVAAACGGSPASRVAGSPRVHLLSGGDTSATPQQRQRKLAFGVKVAQCLRAHGFPSMPDPTGLGANPLPSGINTNSPQFQAAEATCEQRARKALGLP
jgi:hypothetical protein